MMFTIQYHIDLNKQLLSYADYINAEFKLKITRKLLNYSGFVVRLFGKTFSLVIQSLIHLFIYSFIYIFLFVLFYV